MSVSSNMLFQLILGHNLHLGHILGVVYSYFMDYSGDCFLNFLLIALFVICQEKMKHVRHSFLVQQSQGGGACPEQWLDVVPLASLTCDEPMLGWFAAECEAVVM